MINRSRVALTLLAALFILALPASASAAYIVNTVADEPDAAAGAPCETAAGKCSLRAAIQVTNEAGVADNILFDISLFDGQLADTIALATPLPEIKAPVSINAGTCAPLPNPKPCAGVSGPTGNFGIRVEADGVSISGLAVTGSLIGISVINKSEDFTAHGNWIGVKLDGTAGANNTGIFIDPESDGATIGGTEVIQRNVIAGNNNDGLDIEGASEAVVRGNFFGVAPDGTTQMANAQNIEITNSTSGSGFKAEGNEVGGALSQGAAESDECDGGCNVISGAIGTGIDLNGFGVGESPASGPTIIRGNFVGLKATGTGVVANGGIGIRAGGADQVTVGGFAAGEANYVAGGTKGIVSESGGQGFEALANRVGYGSDGSELAPPSENGIFALNENVNEDSEIDTNVVRMTGGVGIETLFLTGRIIDNEVKGGSIGIKTAAGEGEGLIAGNEVEAPTQTGILVENGANDVRRNFVSSSGDAGIMVRNPSGVATTGNSIGNDTEDGENVLESNAGPAIVILEEATEPGSATLIARNRGSLNGGLFISLLNGANGGIEPPTVGAALLSTASGTAEPGATVRVFKKTESDPGELNGFLAKTEADGSGNWKVTYPAVAAGTLVTATQTESGATSQLAAPLAATNPSSGGGGGGNNGAPVPAPAPDVTAPKVTIAKAPKAKSASTTAKFKFKSNEAGSKFQCKLDKGKFKSCKSPKTYKKLKPGKHVFKVRAIDKAGNVGKAAKRKFTVLD